MTLNEKTSIVNRELGKLKSDFTRELIYTVLESWNFKIEGTITQKKVSLLAGHSIATVKRYWSEFKDYAQTLNNDFERQISTPMVQAKPQGISIEKYIYNMRCKFMAMEPSDEKFLKTVFERKGINHVTDDGFDEVHQYICEILRSRQALYTLTVWSLSNFQIPFFQNYGIQLYISSLSNL